MTLEIGIVLAVLAAAVYLFATERLPIDLVAMLVMSALLVSGILTVSEGISGFSNMATVTVAAMFVLSVGLYRTGAVERIGVAMSRTARANAWLGLVFMMVAVAAISAFINNTAAVAIFLPVVLSVARETGLSPSRLLMPLSFASILGGTCTLIGTSTNILISSIAIRHDQPAFGLFEFAVLGIVLTIAGIAYMALVGVRLIPDRRRVGDLTQNYEMADYLIEVVLEPGSASVGKTLEDSPLVKDLDLDVVDLARAGRHQALPGARTVLDVGDTLLVRCDVKKIRQLSEREGIALKPRMKWEDQDLLSEGITLLEAVVAPGSHLAGKTLRGARFRAVYGANVLAIRQQERTHHERLGLTRLRPGDVLLVETPRDRVEGIRSSADFVVVSDVGIPLFRRRKMIPALLVVGGVVASAAFGVLPITAGAVIGSVLMVLIGCITLEEAYGAIDWSVIMLLAGVLTLGVAMEKTGAARLIAGVMITTVGPWGPVALVAAFFLLTSVLTQAMSNNATAALLTPIAIVTAGAFGISERPLLMAVAFAASAAFMTPVGYQTNALVHGAGQYRFSDFLRVGTPLTVICWILSTILIPVIWPF